MEWPVLRTQVAAPHPLGVQGRNPKSELPDGLGCNRIRRFGVRFGHLPDHRLLVVARELEATGFVEGADHRHAIGRTPWSVVSGACPAVEPAIREITAVTL